MKKLFEIGSKMMRSGRQIVLLLGFSVGVIVLLLWLAGKFEKKVSTEVVPTPPEYQIAGQIVQVRRMTLPVTESAVGTVRAVHETSIGSKIMARVVEVNVRAGQKVKKDEILFRLDDTDLRAKLQQAKAALEAAVAVSAQADSDATRAANLLPAKAVSRQDYDRAMAQARSAKADAERYGQALEEAENMLSWATVRSPLDGVVIDKQVDVGDMVMHGTVLARLYNPLRMQLVASVRNSLSGYLEEDKTEVEVQIDGFDHRCFGKVSEKVPESQAASRSFLVKVTGPCPPGIHAGVFGRIYIPVRKEQVLAIPQTAVRSVGQLELVEVLENGKPVKRSIRCGRTGDDDPALGDNVEVLSGLHEGEQIVVPMNSQPAQEANHG